ncbi:hypothetical protein AB0425_19430 [Actinosynnema sp. NPDC051121]
MTSARSGTSNRGSSTWRSGRRPVGGAAHRWALDVAPAHADAFVDALDRRPAISAPLDV